MKTLMGVIGGAAIAASSVTLAWGQEQGQGSALTTSRQRVSYDQPSPLSPSSGTSTVSASSVPQAMERMSDSDVTAELSLGSIYAEGRFGTGSKTTIWSSALAARLRVGKWMLSASLPWMRIRSRSTIFTGIDSTPVLIAPNTSLAKRSADGFGDLTLGAAYTVTSVSSPVELELSGRAKINTASKVSGLSSGEGDYSAGADISFPIGRVTPFGSFTYRLLGDTAAYKLRNGPSSSAGASYALGSESFLLASYHYSKAATRLVSDAHELFAGASTRIAGSPLRLTGFATAGLSRGAAATSAGLALSVGVWKRDVR
jgi:hypothetical protein